MPPVNYKSLNKLTNNILKISKNNDFKEAISQISKLTYKTDSKETLGLDRAIDLYVSYLKELPDFKYDENKHGNNISVYLKALDKQRKKVYKHYNKKW
jgi:antitoxin component HigA of HigAB toxin-antitoxin module